MWSGTAAQATRHAESDSLIAAEFSAALTFDQLLADLSDVASTDQLSTWAQRAIAIKNALPLKEAPRLEQAFTAKAWNLESEDTSTQAPNPELPLSEPASAAAPMAPKRQHRQKAAQAERMTRLDKSVLAFPEPRRVRDKEHLRFVGRQPCLVCGRTPSDAHHVRFAQSRGIGLKVSDEFTVPLCRTHHRELHRTGDEAHWWRNHNQDPMKTALELWGKTRPVGLSSSRFEYTRPGLDSISPE